MMKLLTAGLVAASIAFSTTASAQDSAYTPGTYWDVQAVHVENGQFENYLDFMADTYRRGQDFARSSGWISGFDILVNVNAREGEPDLYIITRLPRLATPEESVERERLYNEHMSQTTRNATQASGQRVSMRRLGSNMLLQELNLRAAR